jgi:hypothetical protein
MPTPEPEALGNRIPEKAYQKIAKTSRRPMPHQNQTKKYGRQRTDDFCLLRCGSAEASPLPSQSGPCATETKIEAHPLEQLMNPSQATLILISKWSKNPDHLRYCSRHKQTSENLPSTRHPHARQSRPRSLLRQPEQPRNPPRNHGLAPERPWPPSSPTVQSAPRRVG